MTREEAIKWILQVQQSEPWQERVIEALNTAIEALKAVPQGDLISRQDAIETVGDWMVKEFGYLDINRGERLIDALEARPSADRPRGRWHYSDGKPATIGQSFGVICDQCGTESEYCTNFCGECGADMRGDGK